MLSLALDFLSTRLMALPTLLPQPDQTQLGQLRSSRKCHRHVVEDEFTFIRAHLDEALRCFSIVDQKCGLILSPGKLELGRTFSGCLQHRHQTRCQLTMSE